MTDYIGDSEPSPNKTIADAVNESAHVGEDDAKQEELAKEEKCVKKLWDEYDQARKFDKRIRGQYAMDRRYAAGTSDLTWAVTTNLIGSFIDILVSFLYARNPDVSCKKAPQVDNRGTKRSDDFAKTMELVVSRLWKKARLKTPAKRAVRSALSVGVGWFKAVLICDSPQNPEMQNDMNDLRDNLAELEATKAAIADIDGADSTDIDDQIAKVNELQESLEQKVEVTIRKYLAVDFVAAQNMQVSLDVENTEDYLDADWNANAIYILKSELMTKFPRLLKADVDSATCYYQRAEKDLEPLTDVVPFAGSGQQLNADYAEQYTTDTTGGGSSGEQNGPAFAKIVELWDKRTDHIKTMAQGVKKWAKEPYEPSYPSSRFYPYFRLSFFEVDGARHPQSLSWRMHKLQDEYSRSRSNWRLTRERSIPGIIFDNTNIEESDAKKLERGVHQELIGIKPINPEKPINASFAEKPVAKVDPRLFDNQPIQSDMEKIGGVQEALQSSVQTPKTATEAGIEQSGFASRTTSDRDSLEDVLTDLANYTAEQALGALSVMDAQRIAGSSAFWPAGMDIDDLLTMVEIEIKAGTTGKPGVDQDKQAWGVILPVLKEAIVQISQLIQAGQIPVAKALSELVRKTMQIMGDDTDPELFIPAIPEPPLGQDLPGADGAPPVGPDGTPLSPPTAGVAGAAGGASPVHAPPGKTPGELKNPQVAPPNLQNPTI